MFIDKVQNTIVGSTQGTRLWEYELAEEFVSVVVGQIVLVVRGPFYGQSFKVIGTLRNRYDKFYFVAEREG